MPKGVLFEISKKLILDIQNNIVTLKSRFVVTNNISDHKP